MARRITTCVPLMLLVMCKLVMMAATHAHTYTLTPLVVHVCTYMGFMTMSFILF